MRRLAAFALFALIVAGCGTSTKPAPPPTATAQTESVAEPAPRTGGTLRIGVPAPGVWFDFELARCCLARTLLSYNGQPTAEGGTVLRPDIAAELPTVSADGLTWTFRLKHGLHYASPYEDVEIVAPDVIRGIEHSVSPKAEDYYGSLYLVIVGAQEFADGRADSISGLEASDPYTLIVHLSKPTGDLGHRFVFPESAPIPADAAAGHEKDIPSYIAPSGPYMIEAAGNDSLTLVRNPTWDPATDSLRAAYPDRIEFSMGGSPEEYAAKVDSGKLDIAVDIKTVAPEEQISRYEGDSELASRVFATPNDAIDFVTMNLAAPPFDDLHVRKAVSLAIDKQGLRELAGAADAGTIATHIAPDSLEDNVLLDYDPYPSPGAGGDSEAAKAEMAQSRYDSNGDGVCDDRACERVRAFTRTDLPGSLDEAELVARSLRAIGIDLSVRPVDDPNKFYAMIFDPSAQVPLALGTRWAKDFPNGSSYFSDQFASAHIGNGNPFLVGATAEQLAGWGYAATSVPSVDDKIDECSALVGGAQVHCWAELDQLLMEDVVPLVPWLSETTVRVVSGRVASYTIDQFGTIPAFDRIALKPGAG